MGSYRRHRVPELLKTTAEGISRDLNPIALQPLGNFLSHVTWKCLQVKQSI